MKAYWTNQKADGTPITDGRLCRVVDAEDGSMPVRVYGLTQEEVFTKIERTMMTAQMMVSQGKPQNGNGNGGAQPPVNGRGAAPPPANPAILSPDETMQLTADLQNPAKSAEASYKLAESERAKRSAAQEEYLAVCRAFGPRHPEFYGNQYNRDLLIAHALLAVGNDPTKVTAQILDNAYNYLQGRGSFLTEDEDPPQRARETNHEPSAEQPAGRPEPVPARPDHGTVSATSHRTARMSAAQLPQWKPKLTLAEINKLTTKETDAILRGTHPKITRKDFEEASDYWYSGARAVA